MSFSGSLFDTAIALAKAHLREDPETSAIYFAEDPSGVEIRLVEVSGSIDTAGEVLPFRFGARPDQGIPYPSVVVLLSPEEWTRIESGELKLPEGWGGLQSLKPLQ